jgi:hypothetical protein
MKDYDYESTIKLKHHEAPAKINKQTGEVSEIIGKTSNIPKGKELFEPKAMFRKSFDATEEFLDKVLTPLEFKVVARMCRMAKMNTNSLQPLSDDLTVLEIAEELHINRREVNKLLAKLFDLGVYGRFEIVKEDIGYTKYWILNPYIRFQGKTISSDIKALFEGTKIHKYYINYIKSNKLN